MEFRDEHFPVREWIVFALDWFGGDLRAETIADLRALDQGIQIREAKAATLERADLPAENGYREFYEIMRRDPCEAWKREHVRMLLDDVNRLTTNFKGAAEEIIRSPDASSDAVRQVAEAVEEVQDAMARTMKKARENP